MPSVAEVLPSLAALKGAAHSALRHLGPAWHGPLVSGTVDVVSRPAMADMELLQAGAEGHRNICHMDSFLLHVLLKNDSEYCCKCNKLQQEITGVLHSVPHKCLSLSHTHIYTYNKMLSLTMQKETADYSHAAHQQLGLPLKTPPATPPPAGSPTGLAAVQPPQTAEAAGCQTELECCPAGPADPRLLLVQPQRQQQQQQQILPPLVPTNGRMLAILFRLLVRTVLLWFVSRLVGSESTAVSQSDSSLPTGLVPLLSLLLLPITFICCISTLDTAACSKAALPSVMPPACTGCSSSSSSSRGIAHALCDWPGARCFASAATTLLCCCCCCCCCY